MVNSISVWMILVVIGVFDAREHRIPNILIITIILFSSLDFVIYFGDGTEYEHFLSRLLGFLTCFFFGFFIYLLGGMAAGDVKLGAAIGFVVGQSSLVEYLQFTSWACVVVGSMYWLLNYSYQAGRISYFQYSATSTGSTKKNLGWAWFRVIYGKKTSTENRYLGCREITHMPFAPILVIGLAMYQYSLH